MAPTLNEIFDRQRTELEQLFEETGYKLRRAASDSLNQIMRRLRQCHSTEEVAAWLIDSTASFCCQAALFEVVENRVRGVRARGFTMTGGDSFEQLEVALAEAPAFAHAVSDRDTVIAIGSPAEVSPQVLAALAHAPSGNIHLYPIVIQDKAVAILYAAGDGSQAVDGAGLELLAHAAAYAVQVLAPEESSVTRQAPGPELISIRGIDMQEHRAEGKIVLRQALEARARWFARTEIARMRLTHRTALEQGRMQRNLYSTLKPAIDAARRTYRQDFLAVSPVIADYLHRELLELAQNDESLLGPEYPGSLV